ncbi:A24 family peptidase [Agrobacterium larrymoorei]|uniref:Prepilin peptidase CpaA n=1 Tax=Agrobacterium larrymoorei TaxID=160699 RepID=A0ABU0UIC9_9HYPH|nr:prepilin peptidase [Agrobacterium larrymoorei]MDQ1184690.1 prepilin peptidase CpaA [Agrobacterium larrymoorei]
MITASIFLVFPLCLALAALTDLFSMTIPNRVSMILLGAFLLLAPLSGMDWQVFAMSLVAGVTVFLACFVLFAFNTMGGGDAKLLTSCAVWFGFNYSLAEFLVAVALIGGILTLGILVLRSRSEEIMATGLPIPDSLLVAKKVPYGIAIAVAGLITYPEAPIVQAAMSAVL